jgi:hypothetical protein
VRAPRPVTTAVLARDLGVGPRTIERDLGRLREAGIPIEVQRGPGGGHRLDVRERPDPVPLSAGEMSGLLAALTAVGPYRSATAMTARDTPGSCRCADGSGPGTRTLGLWIKGIPVPVEGRHGGGADTEPQVAEPLLLADTENGLCARGAAEAAEHDGAAARIRQRPGSTELRGQRRRGDVPPRSPEVPAAPRRQARREDEDHRRVGTRGGTRAASSDRLPSLLRPTIAGHRCSGVTEFWRVRASDRCGVTRCRTGPKLRYPMSVRRVEHQRSRRPSLWPAIPPAAAASTVRPRASAAQPAPWWAACRAWAGSI